MNENWVMVVLGALLVLAGITMTAVRGPMPGSKALYPPPLRVRVMLVGFGAFMFVLGVARLMGS